MSNSCFWLAEIFLIFSETRRHNNCYFVPIIQTNMATIWPNYLKFGRKHLYKVSIKQNDRWATWVQTGPLAFREEDLTRGSCEPASLTWHKVSPRKNVCMPNTSKLLFKSHTSIGFYVKTMSTHGSHLGWRSWSPNTILKVNYPRNIHAMFVLNWLTGFRGEDF